MISLDIGSMRELVRSTRVSPAGPCLFPHSPLPSRAARISEASQILGHWRKCIEEGIAKAKGPDGLGVMASRAIFDLSFRLATRELLETKRMARLGNVRKARESAVGLLEDCGQFLRALEERILNAA
jgi:hypothetical protein